MRHINSDELIEIAIKIENDGFHYYSKMADRANDPELTSLFSYLASEEKKHATDFISMKEKMGHTEIKIPEMYESPDISLYLEALVEGKVFWTDLSVDDILDEIESEEQAVKHAISFEKDSVLFYNDILDLAILEKKDVSLIREMIKQEKIHISKLLMLLAKFQVR